MPKKRLNDEQKRELCRLYTEEGYSSVAAGGAFGITGASALQILKKAGVSRREPGRPSVASDEPLTADELGVLYGTLLGDCSICLPTATSRRPRVTFRHGEAQEGWLRHKASRLQKLGFSVKRIKNGGYGEWIWEARSGSSYQLNEVHELVNRGLTEEWLDRVSVEGLSWWYMDDGSVQYASNSPYVSLHTEGYSEAENWLAATWLTKRGYGATVQVARKPQATYYFVRLNKLGSEAWLTDLRGFAVDCMSYKFPRPSLPAPAVAV